MFSNLLSNELFWAAILAFYAFGIILLTKYIYDYGVKKKIKKDVLLYYNRKFIHIFAGGVVVLAVPFVFKSPFYPMLAGVFLTFLMLAFHSSGRILYWFQTRDNTSDVSFCLMWGIAIFVLWTILGNPWIAVIPPAFIAFGDGITGIVRNFGFKERTKHPIGNIYMAGVCIPIGFYFGSLSGLPGLGFWAVVAAIVASIFERYEFGPIDDNVLITVGATVVIFIGAHVGVVL
jgi:phytol kinase